MSWFIQIGDNRQILYHADRPNYSFSIGKGEDKSWRKCPIWHPITIEVPTRPIKEFEIWMNNPVHINMNLLFVHDIEKTVLENFFLESVFLKHLCKKKSVYVSVDVYAIILVYKHAMNKRGIS